jgi:hypothetical protein
VRYLTRLQSKLRQLVCEIKYIAGAYIEYSIDVIACNHTKAFNKQENLPI